MATAAKSQKSTSDEKPSKYEPSAELVAQGEPVKALLATQKNVSVADVLRRAHNTVAAARRRAGEIVMNREKLPVPKGRLSLTGDQVAAIDKVMQLARTAPALPSDQRELSPDELQALTARFLAAKAVIGILDEQVKGIRGAMLNHLTIEGERAGSVTDETPRDKTGWALVPAKFSAEDESNVLSVETQSGGATITAQDVEALKEQGVISNRDLLECTEYVRQIDESGWFTLIKRKPWLAVILSEKASHSAPKISLNVRKA